MSRALGTEEACEDFAEKILTNQAEFNDYPEMAAVIDEYLNLFEKGYVNEDYMTVSYDEILGRLASGEIAMIYGATEILTSIEESYPDAEFSIFNYFEARPGFPNIEGVDGNEEAMNPVIKK